MCCIGVERSIVTFFVPEQVVGGGRGEVRRRVGGEWGKEEEGGWGKVRARTADVEGRRDGMRKERGVRGRQRARNGCG